MANLYYKSGDEWLPLGGGSLPVGSYVYSDNNVSPAADMGGTWESLGYTAVTLVVFLNKDDNSIYNNTVLFRFYNQIYGIINGYDSWDSTITLPSSNIIINSYSMGSSYQVYYYGFSDRGVNGGGGYVFGNQNTGDCSFRPEKGMTHINYTTDVPLSTDVLGGKYLFKRTA